MSRNQINQSNSLDEEQEVGKKIRSELFFPQYQVP